MKNKIDSIVIGGFDGMHLGHQQLFKKLSKYGAIVVIQTPYGNLTPYNKRKEYSNFPIYYYPLDEIKHLQAQEFIALLQEEFPGLKKIIVGYDFRFGNKAASDVIDLNRLFPYDVEVVDEFKHMSISVHSRVIREYLRDGDIKTATALLGHSYCFEGIHVKGQGLGQKQFVPTINLNVDDAYLLPKEGVYITKTKINDILYNSVSFLGHRVSTDGNFAVETHLLNVNMDDKDFKKVEIIFIDNLRDNRKFTNIHELKSQIASDIKEALNFFNNL